MCPASSISTIREPPGSPRAMAAISAGGGDGILPSHDHQRGQSICGSSGVKSGRSARPAAAAANPAAIAAKDDLPQAIDHFGSPRQRGGREQLGQHRLGQHAGAFPLDPRGRLAARGGGLRRIGRRPGVAQHQPAEPRTDAPGRTAWPRSRPSTARPARPARRSPGRRAWRPGRRRTGRTVTRPGVTPLWPKPRRSGASTRCLGTRAAICRSHIAWVSGKPCNSTTGRPLPPSATARLMSRR